MRIVERIDCITVQHEDGSAIMIYEVDEYHPIFLGILDGEHPSGAANALAKCEHLSLLKAARDRRLKLDRANDLLLRQVRGEQVSVTEVIKYLEGGAP